MRIQFLDFSPLVSLKVDVSCGISVLNMKKIKKTPLNLLGYTHKEEAVSPKHKLVTGLVYPWKVL